MRQRVLTPEEATKLIATCADKTPIDLRDRALIVVGLETGMRCMSLAAMRLEAIETWKAGYSIVPVPIIGSREPYNVPLSDVAIAALEPWRAWLRTQGLTDGPVFCPLVRRVARGGKLVYELPSTAPAALSRVAIYKIVVRRAHKAKLKDVHPNVFRNTFITWRMEAGFAPYKIAAITGLKMTNLTGMGSLGQHIDVAAVGAEARQGTPAWLTKLIRSRS